MADGPERVERRLAAIFAADVVGYSRLMRSDEVGTLRKLTASRAVMDALIAQHGDRIANTAGDSVLAEFPSAVDAVRCAVEVQSALAGSDEDSLPFRIGVHVGDVMVKGGDLLGDGVNIAARLETLAEPGGVALSADAYAQVRRLLPFEFADLGPQSLKNIEEPVRVYALKATATPPSHSPGSSAPDKPSIAVLPFANLSGDPEQDYFADGLVDDIITALSRVRWFFVIGRSSSFAYKGKAADARQVGRELGVRYVLEGSVRRAGNRVRLSGQLVEAETGRHLWADRFDGDLADIFELQDRITESVVGAIEPNLRLAEIRRAQKKPTEHLDAYDLYLRALPPLYAYTETGFRKAEALLREAVARDPGYSDALATLADCVGRMALNGWQSDRQLALREACDLAGRAVAADPENAIALATAAWAYAILAGRFGPALELADRALQVHPNSTSIRSYCGWVFAYAGESNRAITQFEEARRLSPIDPRSYFPLLGMAVAHFFARRFEETVRLTRRILDDVPTHNIAHRYLAAALAHLGRRDEAAVAASAMLKGQPSWTLRTARTATFQHAWMLELYVEGLRMAGLPE